MRCDDIQAKRKRVYDRLQRFVENRAMRKLDAYIAAVEAGIYVDEHNQEHRQSVRLINAINRGSNEDND